MTRLILIVKLTRRIMTLRVLDKKKKKNIYRRERERARDRLAFFLTVTSR